MDHGEIMVHDIEQMLNDIVSDKIQIKDLAPEQLEAVMDYIRDVFTGMLGGENDAFAEGMLEIVDVIHTAIENRSVAEAESESWDQDILASIERGNTYFEMENYVVQ